MSKREEEKPARPRDRDSPTAFYVYCIVERSEGESMLVGSLPEAIEPSASLEIVAHDDLAAIISPVPLKDYGEGVLIDRLADPAWTAVRAMRHEHVVEYFARSISVVPLSMGTIYLESDGVRKMLTDRQDELRATVARLRGREEWGVNLYCDRAELMKSITSLSSRLRELNKRAAVASPGQSYLMQKKIDALRMDEARAEMRRLVDLVEQQLRDRSDAGKRLRVLKVETTEHGELLAKFAFLIERTRFDEFRKTAERVAQEQMSTGLRIELTGPWPAYNFISNQEE